jgi:hypothetical protein
VSSIALPLRVYEYWVMQYRRVWRGTAITSIINPVFYLGALGIGLGTLVNQSSANSRTSTTWPLECSRRRQ